MTLAEQLHRMDACDEAICWVGNRTLERAWRECERSDWMMWFLRELGIDTRRCAGEFALRVWHLVPAEAQLACAWAIDCALRNADDDESFAASATATIAYAAEAAHAAADAARADLSLFAGLAAEAAAAEAGDAEAGDAERRAQCDIIRELIPLENVRAALNKRTV